MTTATILGDLLYCVCMCMCACGGAYPTPICLHNCQVLYGNGVITQLTGLLFG